MENKKYESNGEKNSGEFVGKLAPYGYIKDSKDKHKFLIDNNVSYIIKKIFDMILDWKSRKEVTDFLNDNDILTPSEYLKINTNLNIENNIKYIYIGKDKKIKINYK